LKFGTDRTNRNSSSSDSYFNSINISIVYTINFIVN